MNMSALFFRNIWFRVMFMLLGVCLLVSATYFWYWSEKYSGISEQEVTLLVKQQELNHNSYPLSVYVSQQPNRRASYEQVTTRILKMAANSSSVEITQHINRIAKATHIHKTGIRWLGETISPLYIEKTFELKVVGDFMSLEQFFRTIAEHERLLSFSYSQWLKSGRDDNIVVITKGHSYQWIAERL